MEIILVPGLWLDSSSWDRVVPELEAAGHRAHPVTLPGMQSNDTDRSKITLQDHVDAVVEVIDGCDATARVVLVGHSAGCAICYAAIDARPDRVAKAVFVGGFPTADGDTLASGFRVEGDDIPLPDWSEMDDEDLVDLDDEARAAFRARAIPSPASLARDPQRLNDDRRYDVPITAVATEYTSAMLRDWIDSGEQPVREFVKIRDVEYVDLPTGHWPQFTRPEDLAQVILAALPRSHRSGH